jgi:AraC family transcriptional activator of tynA and feaB
MKEAVGGVQMEAINTRPESPNRSRLAAWAAQYGAQFDRSDILTNDLARFDAQMRVGKLGALRFAQMACRGSAVDRVLTGDPGEAPLGYTLIVQLEGQGTLSQYGQIAQLNPGDLALCDNHAPHRHHIDEGSSLLLLRVPARALRSHLPSPEQFCGRRLAASSGMTIVATSLARNLCGQANANLPAAVQECLSRQLLETVSLAFSLAFGQLIASSSVVGGRYARARLFIEQNLGDPELGPNSIACALNVSARYLRMIFAREGECISSYVLRRRLEETARQLADPRWRGRSICEIAFTWGFNSAPHFSRSFREHFGIPPREYRARQATTQQDGQAQPDTLAAVG